MIQLETHGRVETKWKWNVWRFDGTSVAFFSSSVIKHSIRLFDFCNCLPQPTNQMAMLYFILLTLSNPEQKKNQQNSKTLKFQQFYIVSLYVEIARFYFGTVGKLVLKNRLRTWYEFYNSLNLFIEIFITSSAFNYASLSLPHVRLHYGKSFTILRINFCFSREKSIFFVFN